jgi:hypothetical protein
MAICYVAALTSLARAEMPIDPAIALGADLGAVGFSWTAGDVQLYHPGLSASADPMNPHELSYLVGHKPQAIDIRLRSSVLA